VQHGEPAVFVLVSQDVVHVAGPVRAYAEREPELEGDVGTDRRARQDRHALRFALPLDDVLLPLVRADPRAAELFQRSQPDEM
jgi:hypothetical protein